MPYLDDWIPLTGNTYPVRRKLSSMGCRYDAHRKTWICPPHLAMLAQSIVESPHLYAEEEETARDYQDYD